MTDILPWVPILVGSIIVVFDIRATLYFRRQYRIIGRNWVIRAFYLIAAIITSVVIILTVARAILLMFSASAPLPDDNNIIRSYTQFVAGSAVVVLAIIPILMEVYFEEHEGRQ